MDWDLVLLGSHLDDSVGPPLASIGHRDDGVGLLYPGFVHSLAGVPEAGKTWLALSLAIEIERSGSRCIYIDFDSTARAIRPRLAALGFPTDRKRGLLYTNGGCWQNASWLIRRLREKVEKGVRLDLIVIDGVTSAMRASDLDPVTTKDVSEFLSRLARPFASLGAAVLLLDHVVKSRDGRGRWPYGSQHKLAGTDVAFALESVKPFGIGIEGRSRLLVSKDRHGMLRRAGVPAHDGMTTLADLVITSTEHAGPVQVRLEPPETKAFRPTVLMARVSEALERAGEPLSSRQVEESVVGKANYVRQALDSLVQERFVAREDGPRRSKLHRSLRPFLPSEAPGLPDTDGVSPAARKPDPARPDRLTAPEPSAEATVSRGPTASQRVPDPVAPTASRVPPLRGGHAGDAVTGTGVRDVSSDTLEHPVTGSETAPLGRIDRTGRDDSARSSISAGAAAEDVTPEPEPASPLRQT